MSMNFRFQDSRTFKALLKALVVVNENILFKVSDAGLFVKVMDASHTTMATLDWSKNGFEEWYGFGNDTYFQLRVTDLLNTVFKKAKKDESVAIEFKDDKDDKDVGTAIITLRAKYPRITSTRVEYVEKPEECPIPQVRYTCRIKIVTKDLLEILEDVQQVSHAEVIIRCDTKNKLTFEAEKFKVPLDTDNDVILGIDAKEDSEVKISLPVLIPYIKAMKPLVDIVTLEYATDMPLKITAQAGFSGTCVLVYYIAPRVHDKEVKNDE